MLRALKFVFGTVIAVALIGGFAVFALGVPMPWQGTPAKAEAPPLAPRLAVELVPGTPNTLTVPRDIRESLGIRVRGEDRLAVAALPTKTHPLVMPGSTALDPARIWRIRARFAPAEVVSITMVDDAQQQYPPAKTPEQHELRQGDVVRKGQELAVFFSPDVGNKKNDLFEAIVQLRLDQVILDRAEKAGNALPDYFLWNARRNVDTDRSTVRRAKNMLKVWNISDEDIEAVEKEAMRLSIVEGRRQEYKEDEWAEKHHHWARVVLRAPEDGVVVERNVAKNETVVDNTVNLFTIARVDQLAVFANVPEDDLPALHALPGGQLRWTVRTVGSPPVPGFIDTIGVLIDPSQHTAVVKGHINNPNDVLRAGQFISATVELPPPPDVVEVPISAVVDDGQQCVVFVQSDPEKHPDRFTMRRVQLTHRFEKTAFVRSKPFAMVELLLTAEDEELGLLPREPLRPGERILQSGGGELKAALLDLQSSSDKGQKEGKDK
jgi:cobalt-zinc-cadmium efflux system membrane fusion protein